ncbi:MAG TPA: tRNA (cytidine(34)-2'-O)-methyltransferase [Polyangiaceae bacterium]
MSDAHLFPKTERLRANAVKRPFFVVLVEPEIPPNTGNIARLCGATCCPLHLVGQLGFRIDEHAVRRAGLDYWHLVEVHQHANWQQCETTLTQYRDPGQPGRSWFFTGRARRSLYEADILPGDALVFGKESVGLPHELLDSHPDSLLAIPTLGAVRSLNLANAVSIALFEALRRNGLLDVSYDEG